MNALKVYEKVASDYQHLDFELDNDSTNEKTIFTANITCDEYDDEIYVKVIVYNSGSIHVFFTFDKIEVSLKTLLMINTFNDETSWLKAYITEINNNNYLELHMAFPNSTNDDEASSNISFALENLLNESVINLLRPITNLTY